MRFFSNILCFFAIQQYPSSPTKVNQERQKEIDTKLQKLKSQLSIASCQRNKQRQTELHQEIRTLRAAQTSMLF